MDNQNIKALLENWRRRSIAFEITRQTIGSVDGFPDPDGAKRASQAHQDELERCIMELEDVLP